MSLQGFAKRHGIEIHFVKWRSLANCFGVSLLFRDRLYLDSMPRHAWDDDIVERIIGRRCALESIDTDLLHPAETKTIDLWTWTANPSLIPKKVWLTFTNRTKDAKLQSILVTETPPEHWQAPSILSSSTWMKFMTTLPPPSTTKATSP